MGAIILDKGVVIYEYVRGQFGIGVHFYLQQSSELL